MGSRFRLAWGALLVAGALILWLALRGAEDTPETAALEATRAEHAARVNALDASDRVLRRAEAPTTAAGALASSAPSFGARDLVARVLDASGEPVHDVDVQLWTALSTPDERGEWQLYHQAFSARGDLPRHGMRIPADALAAAFAQARDARTSGREVGVYLCAPNSLAKCTHVELVETELPSTDVELRLGPSGFLRIEAQRPDGSFYEESIHVVMQAAELQEPSPSSLQARMPKQIHRRIAAQRDRLRVPVTTALRVTIAQNLNRDQEFLGEQREIAGPQTEGEEVVLRVSLRAARILVGRLLSLSGEPLSERSLLASYALPAGLQGDSAGKTDAEGRFRIALQCDSLEKRIEKLRLFPLDPQARRQMSSELENRPHAVLTALELPETHIVDLGEVVIQPSAKHFLASGVVVDGTGTPIENAFVYAWTGAPPRRLDQESRLTDHEGRFEIYSLESASSLLLAAEKKGLVRQRGARVEIGDRSVRLVLGSGAAIEGTVRVPEGFPLSALEIHRVFDGRTQERLTPAADGRFRFAGCAPGAHTLAFQLAPWKPVLELAGLAVAGEELCADPRLREIDLRRLLTTLRIRALDVDGAPLAQTSLELSIDGTKWQAKPIRTDASARAALGLPIEVQAVAISLHGGAPTVVRCASEEQDVRLAGPLVVELALDPAPELPADLRLCVSLELFGPDGTAPRPPVFASSEAAFEAGRSTHRVPLAARYGVRWSVRTTDSQPYRAVLASETLAIEVEPATEPQRFAVSPSLDALRAALTKLGR